jgi:hypothetical protein
LEIFNKAFLNYLRQLLVISVDESLSKTLSLELTSEQLEKSQKIAKDNTGRILEIITEFSEIQNKIRSAFIPQLPLEMAIVRLGNYELRIMNHESDESSKLKVKSEKSQLEVKNYELSAVVQEAAKEEEKAEEDEKPAIKKFNNVTVDIDDVKVKWKEIIRETKPFNHSISLFLLNCEPVKVENNHLSIATKYKFYKDKLSETQNKLTIEKVLATIFGSGLRVKYLSEDEAGIKIKTPAKDSPSSSTLAPSKPKENGSLLNDAMEMMGGKIVEE